MAQKAVTVFLMFAVVHAASGFSAVPSRFNLTSATANQVTFQLQDNTPVVKPLIFSGQQHISVHFPDETDFMIVSGVSIPVAIKVFAIPAQARKVSLNILSESWEALEPRAPLIPAFIQLPDGSLTKAVPADDSPVDPSIFRPAIVDTGWFRELKIARVRIPLLRKSGHAYEYLHQAAFQLSWDLPGFSPQQAQTIELPPEELSYYERVVENKSYIRAFLRSTGVQPAKRSSSSLEGERFLKFIIDNTGIYKIDGATLAQNGIALDSIDPAQIRMYNNGGRPLPDPIQIQRPDSLIEIPVFVADGGDGRFDENDAIYFFGQSVHDWEYSTTEGRWRHYTNPYTNENVYWLSVSPKPSPAKRLDFIEVDGSGTSPDTRGFRLQKIENDIVNLIRSGRQWLGRELTASENRASFTFRLQNPPPDSRGYVYLKMAAQTSGQHTVQVFLNGSPLGIMNWRGRAIYEGYIYVANSRKVFDFTGGLQAGENKIDLLYTTSGAFGSVRVDWIEFVTEDELVAEDNQALFAAPPQSGVAAFRIKNIENEPLVMEISRPGEPRLLTFQKQDDEVIFADTLSSVIPRRYIVASKFLQPVRIEPYVFSDLRSPEHKADVIIVTHQDFMSQALQLADHKRRFAGYDVEVVDIENILNEFGWGLLDPVAIRDFVAYAYYNWQKKPRYLIFLGDGDYDYRNIENKNDKNWIPPYQTTEPSELDNRNLEGFFAYVSGNDRIMDLAVGRIAVKTAEEAQNVVDKIIFYETDPEYGFWRTVLTMVADDELVRGGVGNETFHVIDADNIAENYVPDYINVRKIYLMEYRGVRSASISGIRKPEAQLDLINQINEGTLILNYIGHGNPQQWAHEVVFMQSEDYPRVQNGKRLNFIVAATCDFGRFDMPNAQSFAEDLLNARNRGVIGLVTASRAVYASQNAAFNIQYYRQIFQDNLQTIPVGDALVLARMFTNNIINDEKYTILGDPTLKLAIPDHWARVSALIPDSLFALQKTTISGETRDARNVFAAASGEIQVVVFDDPKPTTYRTKAGSVVFYTLPGNLLFRGVGTIENGRFDLSFIVPKDITYGGQNARVSLYGFTDAWEAVGYTDEIPISLRSSIVFDEEGPTIEIQFEGRENFVSGDPIPQNATLIATLSDSVSGINVTGEIGHKITLTLDNDIQNQIDLTSKFIYFPNSFTSGELVTRLPTLTPGLHTAELKAWDNSNNSSKLTFDFVVTETSTLQITELMNYPNPFRDQTAFTFFLNAEAEVEIKIYTLSGRLIRTLDGIPGRPGYNQVTWDGRDALGEEVANGIYLYKIVARARLNGELHATEKIEKLAIQK